MLSPRSLPFPTSFGYGATHSPAAGEDWEVRLKDRLGVALNASSRMADRASSLVQAGTSDRQRHRDAEHRVVGRLYAETQPALCAREPRQVAAPGCGPCH